MVMEERQVSPHAVGTALALVALDIDGTLLGRDMRIPAATVEAVAQVRAAGHHVVLASGRSLVGILPVARLLGIDRGWVVASNGAVMARLSKDLPGGYALVDVRTFNVEPVVRLVRAETPEALIGVEEIGWGYRVTERFADGLVNGDQRVVRDPELWDVPVSRAICRGAGVLDLLAPLRSLGVTATPAGPDWVDVTPVHLSKATVLESVRVLLGIDAARTVAVGDGINDLEMITWSARGVAMGHAPAAVRDAADEVTGTIDEHGVVSVLQSLL